MISRLMHNSDRSYQCEGDVAGLHFEDNIMLDTGDPGAPKSDLKSLMLHEKKRDILPGRLWFPQALMYSWPALSSRDMYTKGRHWRQLKYSGGRQHGTKVERT